MLLLLLCPQVHTYQRLTPFSVLDQAVESLDNLRPGDCIVCFSKNDIYSISRQIEIRGLECAVIYGSLPPGGFHVNQGGKLLLLSMRKSFRVKLQIIELFCYFVIHRYQTVTSQKVQ